MEFLIVFDIVNAALLLWLWYITLKKYPSLPEQIPTKIDFEGKPYRFGNKKLVFALPVMALLIFGLFIYVFQFPEKFNYPVGITHENQGRQTLIAVLGLRLLQFSASLIFLNLQDFTLRKAVNTEAKPKVSMVAILLSWIAVVLVFITIAVVIK